MANREGSGRTGVAAQAARRRGLAWKLARNRHLLLLLAPAAVFIVVFAYIPMAGVVLAFKDFNYSQGIIGSRWNGLANYQFLLISNKLWPLTRNTLLYNLAFICVGMVLQVGFAVVINEIGSRWFKKTFQSFMFLPYFISWVIVVPMVQVFFDFDNGMLSRILAALGRQRVNIYVDAEPWPALLVLLRAWKDTGYGSIVYLAVISGLDQEMYEAADIDGASIWRKVFGITLPNLLPTMIIMFLLSIGQVFRGDFGMFYQLIGNNGVLLETADILDLFIYRSMASGSSIGMAAAAGLYQSVLCFFTVMAVNALVKRIEPDYSLF